MPTAPNMFREVSSYGGPFIMIGASNLLDWEGCDEPSGWRVVEATFRWQGAGSTATDYDRACNVEGDVGVISVGAGMRSGDALVLASEPVTTGVWSADASSMPLVFQCEYGGNRASIGAALSALSPKMLASLSWQDVTAKFRVSSNPMYLFDSACPGWAVGNQDENFATFDAPVGRYKIARSQFDHSEETRLVLYRFEAIPEV